MFAVVGVEGDLGWFGMALPTYGFHYVNSLAGKSRAADTLMVLTASYSPWVIALLVFLLTLRKRTRLLGIKAAASAALALLFNWLIAAVYYSPRPYIAYNLTPLVSAGTESSFPSDHTTLAAAVALAVLPEHRAMGVLLLLFAILTGVSRVYCGLHYPVDVAGGVATAALAALLVRRAGG
ncbi:MAG: phosphatase PAP2 family protein [Euryarchaeota archaeon]|nr:phosphatase PAP2 family protein [Euryarchaeota archaeon]